MGNVVGATVRHSLEAPGPVMICDGQQRLVFANRAMMTTRSLDGNPEEELYELRQLVGDLSLILEHPIFPAEISSRCDT
jgi:hypothetical protein